MISFLGLFCYILWRKRWPLTLAFIVTSTTVEPSTSAQQSESHCRHHHIQCPYTGLETLYKIFSLGLLWSGALHSSSFSTLNGTSLHAATNKLLAKHLHSVILIANAELCCNFCWCLLCSCAGRAAAKHACIHHKCGWKRCTYCQTPSSPQVCENKKGHLSSKRRCWASLHFSQ